MTMRIAATALFLAAVMTAAVFAQDATIDYAVALVNGEPLTRRQIEERQAQLARQAPFKDAGGPTFDLTLQLEIERILLVQAAKREFDEQMLEYMKSRAAEIAAKRRDPRIFDPNLKEAKTNDLYYADLLVQAYLQRKLYDTVAVTPSEIRKYYDDNPALFSTAGTVTVSEILIRLEKHTAEEAQALAEKAAARIKAGEDFAVVAREMSEGPYAAAGGLWPAQQKGGLIADVENAAARLTAGQVSEPFKSPLGWHVIRVEENSLAQHKRYTEVQAKIYADLLMSRQREARGRLLATLRGNAVIKIADAQ